MYFAILLSILPFFASTMCSKTPSKPASRQPLRLTAIAAANGKSILQCWQLDTPLGISSQPGTSGVAVQQLGDISNASYTVIPPSYDGGLHTAPRRQFVSFLSGEARVTFPSSDQEVWIQGGKQGLIFAADTDAVSREGHFTTYPSKKETIALQIGVEGDKEPPHTVLYEGPCKGHKS